MCHVLRVNFGATRTAAVSSAAHVLLSPGILLSSPMLPMLRFD
jgi:hypothetical protein